MYLVIIMYMLFASTFTLGKVVLAYLDPIFFIGIRMLIAGFILLSYLYFFKREHLVLKKKHWKLFAQIALFHIYFAYVLESVALKYLTSFKVAFLWDLSPFIAAILAYFFLSEKMNAQKIIGLLIGFIGIFIMLTNGESPGEVGTYTLLRISFPEFFTILAVISAAYGWIVFKKLTKGEGYSPLFINGFGMVLGGFLALITSFFIEGYPTVKISSSSFTSDILAVSGYTLLLIIVANIIAYNLYGHLLKKYSVTFLAFSGFICPLFAALLGNVFLGEMPSTNFFLSVTIVTLGLYIFYRQELKFRKSPAPREIDKRDKS